MRRKAFFSLNEDIGREGKKVSPIHEKPLEIERWNVVLIPSDLCHAETPYRFQTPDSLRREASQAAGAAPTLRYGPAGDSAARPDLRARLVTAVLRLHFVSSRQRHSPRPLSRTTEFVRLVPKTFLLAYPFLFLPVSAHFKNDKLSLLEPEL